jgi:hypothetical protein
MAEVSRSQPTPVAGTTADHDGPRPLPGIDGPPPSPPSIIDTPTQGQRIHRYGAWQLSIADPPQGWPTNLDTSTERGMAGLLNSVNPATLQLDDNGQCRIKLVAYVCHIALAEDQQTHEIDEAPRTVLIDVSGRTFVTRSDHAPLKIQNYLAVFPPERWTTGIPIVIREHRSTRTKRTSHVIEIDLS